jgi:hypothetical protein
MSTSYFRFVTLISESLVLIITTASITGFLTTDFKALERLLLLSGISMIAHFYQEISTGMYHSFLMSKRSNFEAEFLDVQTWENLLP